VEEVVERGEFLLGRAGGGGDRREWGCGGHALGR
jgi:hypothetical protein